MLDKFLNLEGVTPLDEEQQKAIVGSLCPPDCQGTPPYTPTGNCC